MQLFDGVGWQPTAVTRVGCSYLTLQVGSETARMKLFDANLQPAAIK